MSFARSATLVVKRKMPFRVAPIYTTRERPSLYVSFLSAIIALTKRSSPTLTRVTVKAGCFLRLMFDRRFPAILFAPLRCPSLSLLADQQRATETLLEHLSQTRRIA